MDEQISLRTSFLRNMMLIAVVSTSLLFTMWIVVEYLAFIERAEYSRRMFAETQQDLLKQEVKAVADYINYRIHQTEITTDTIVKERVYEAHAIAANIHRQNTDKPPAVIGKMIKDALRELRFNEGRGYYFIFDLEGVEQLFADRPELEGQNMLTVQGARGEFVVRDMIDLVLAKEEGWYRYTWTKPGEASNSFAKTAYVKLFEPLGWVIGTGEYVSDVQEDIQEEVLTRISGLRFGKDGYFFGSIKGGLPLFTHGVITKGTAAIWNLTDPQGVKITQEQNIAAQQPDGGFVRYSWVKPDSMVPSPKISYVVSIPEWNWIVGAGIYLDAIEGEIGEQKKTLRDDLTRQALLFAALLLFLLLLTFFWAKKIADSIQKAMATFSLFFSRASSESVSIQHESLPFQEFRDIARSANAMMVTRQQAETALRESEHRHRIIFEKSPLGMVLFDPTGTITDCNDKFIEFMGSSRQKLIGFNTARQSTPQMQDAIRKALGGKASLYEDTYTSITGNKTRDLRVLFNPVTPDVTPTQVIATLEDITERRSAEAERRQLESRLQQAQKMEAIGTLAGGIAHDFNNSLGAILGYAEMARTDSPPESTMAGDLEEILKAGNRAKDLVKQILAFSRQADTERILLFPAVIIKETIKMLRPSLPSTIEITSEIAPHTNAVLADPSQIHQIVMNLCTNAFHAMEESGGTLGIILKETDWTGTEPSGQELPPGRYIQLTVSDTGPGISPEVQRRMFEPFFTTKETGKGTGMGLSTVHGIVKSYGGLITCDSKLGQGTSFHVFLPSEAEIPQSTDATLSLPPTGDEHILLVDDEEMLADMGGAMLERLGYTVTVRTNSFDALKTFEDQPDTFAAVITDRTMPGLTGSDLARRLLQIRPNLPIILCSGYTTAISEQKAKSLGIREVATKPLAMKDIARLLRKVLDE